MEAKGGRASAAFREEALPHLDAVYRFALRLAGAPDAAEELVQETFLRALRSWDQYTPGTRCKSWLFTICRNVFYREWERGRRHERVLAGLTSSPTGGGGMPPLVSSVWVATEEADPEGRFFDSFVDEEVLREVDRLPDEYRKVLLLSDLEELSYQEIADLLQIPVGTVKSRLFRGRRLLEEALYDYAVEMGYVKRRAS